MSWSSIRLLSLKDMLSQLKQFSVACNGVITDLVLFCLNENIQNIWYLMLWTWSLEIDSIDSTTFLVYHSSICLRHIFYCSITKCYLKVDTCKYKLLVFHHYLDRKLNLVHIHSILKSLMIQIIRLALTGVIYSPSMPLL